MSFRAPPLSSAHEAAGAKTTEFGGWEMPVEFDSIRTEHESVRESAGKFDVSHMGEIEVSGPDARELCDRLVTNDVSRLDIGEAQYAAITNEDGIILDDTLVYRLGDETYLFIPNAGHDEQMADRWETHREEWELDCSIENVTEEYALIALQGPDAEELLAEAAGPGESDAVSDIGRFEHADVAVAGVECLVSRTGYTGEDGFEVMTPWGKAEPVWEALGCQPCGLGARDTLRMEMGFLLSGQDFDAEEQTRTPYEAGIGFVVALDTEFVGRDALARQREAGIEEEFVGLFLRERGVPRHGYPITDGEGKAVGVVTSGTMSPTLSEPIGLGYVPTEFGEPGTAVGVEVRGREKKAEIQALPLLEDKR